MKNDVHPRIETIGDACGLRFDSNVEEVYKKCLVLYGRGGLMPCLNLHAFIPNHAGLPIDFSGNKTICCFEVVCSILERPHAVA